MVGVNKLFKNKEDKEKLTNNDPEKAELDSFDETVYPNVVIERTVKSRTCARILCLISCFLFGCFLIIAGVVLYKYFTKPKIWYGECGIKFRTPESGYLIDHGGLVADDLADKPVFNPKERINYDTESDSDEDENSEFHQEMSLNITGQSEKIIVPEVSIYKKAAFIHDFIRNLSVIYDITANRCFIMSLDRTKVSPPKDIFDIIKKTLNGYYLLDNTLIHQQMTVQTPPITDLSSYGQNIQDICKNATSYLLKKRNLIGEDHLVDKRNALLRREKRCEFANHFRHSVGANTIVYDFVC